MKLNEEIVAAISAHAAEACPEECCGFIVATGKRKRAVIRAKNVAENRRHNWRIAPADQIAAEAEGTVVAVYHSHPYGRAVASEADKVACEACDVPFVILAWPTLEIEIIKPCGYIAPLIGREFVHGVTDCYTLIRDYFRTRGVTLPDFYREDKWWEKGQDLYMENVVKPENGFAIIGTDWRAAKPGDILLMRLMSQRVNHSAIILDGMRVLHHVPNRLSARENFSQFWQQCVACVARHESALPHDDNLSAR